MIKKIAFITILMVQSLWIFAQKPLDYQINKADIYLNGARVNSVSKISLEKGSHTLIISNITDAIVEKSLQAKISSGANIVSVNISRNYMDISSLTKKEQDLFDAQKKLITEKELSEIEKQTVQDEINLLNLLVRGKDGDDKKHTVTELRELTKFYADKINELKKESYRITQEITKIQEELMRINAQLVEERALKNKNYNQIEVTVEVTSAGSKTIELGYFVTRCGWQPSYDIKAEGKDKPVHIVYKASVWQNTGIDWKDCEITLMTNQPVQDQNRPVLSPVFVEFYTPSPQAREYETMADESVEAEKDLVQMYSNMVELSQQAKQSIPQNTVYHTDINITYQIGAKQSIAGNGKSQVLTLDNKQIDARFLYHAIPKLTEQVFLLAYIPKWSNLNLLNGTASIYLQDAFIGQIQIRENYTGEEYPLSFGVDNRITVKRNKKQDLSSESRIGSEKREKISYEFLLRNNLSTDIDIEILDQIPVSKNKNIKVMLEDKGEAEYTESIGLLKWTVPVRAGQSYNLGFTYELRYPKDNTITYSYY